VRIRSARSVMVRIVLGKRLVAQSRAQRAGMERFLLLLLWSHP